MIALLISLGLGVITFLLVYFFFGIISAILPAVVVMALCFFWLSRRLAKKIEDAMKQVMNDLQRGKFEESIGLLKKIQKKYSRQQFFLGSTLDGQIGSIYFLRKEFKSAKPYLERAFVRHWVAKAMLAVIYYWKKEYGKMNEVFEQAAKYSPKQGLLWSVWAYCVWRTGDNAKAIEILSKGNQKLKGADDRLVANLLSLQNAKRMKMRGYGEQWYQFQLEVPPEQNKMRQGRVRFSGRA